MSIKIYDGLISTISNKTELSNRIRHALSGLFLEKFYNICESVKKLPADATWGETNGLFRGDELISKQPYDIYNRVLELNNLSSRTFSAADIMYEVIIIDNAAGGNPLVLVYGEKSREYIQRLKDWHLVRDYGYWDNVDPDESASEQEWEEREKAWELIYDHSPAEMGISIKSPSLSSTGLYMIGRKWTMKDF